MNEIFLDRSEKKKNAVIYNTMVLRSQTHKRTKRNKRPLTETSKWKRCPLGGSFSQQHPAKSYLCLARLQPEKNCYNFVSCFISWLTIWLKILFYARSVWPEQPSHCERTWCLIYAATLQTTFFVISLFWCFGVTTSIKLILLSFRVSTVCIEDTTDHLLLEERNASFLGH